MTDYTEAAKQFCWDNLSAETQAGYIKRASDAAIRAEAKAAQLDVVANSLYEIIEDGYCLDDAGSLELDRYRGMAEAAIAAYLSTVPKSDATTQGRISYG